MVIKYSINPQRFFVLIIVLSLFAVILGFAVFGQEVHISPDSSSESLAIEQEEVTLLSVPAVIESPSTVVGESSYGDNLANLDNSLADKVVAYSLNESLDNVVEISSKTDNSINGENYVLYHDGEKEIETNVQVDPSVEISKTERILPKIDSWTKEVTVSSEEHFAHPVTVYTDIPEISGAKYSLVWVNDGFREVGDENSFDLKFYDTDNNGLNDRVSFIVPHLSEQIFQISVSSSIISTNQTSNSSSLPIILSTLSPGSLVISNNSLLFGFNISYYDPSIISCTFTLNSSIFIYTNNSISSLGNVSLSLASLQNGNYSWSMSCLDNSDANYNSSVIGAFQIAINYSPIISFNTTHILISANQTVQFPVLIATPDNRALSYTLYYGESAPVGPTGTNGLSATFSHTYNSVGNYTVIFTVIDGANVITLSKLITVVPIQIVNLTTNSSNVNQTVFSVQLLEPAQNAVFNTENINFSYRVNSNIQISNCSFNLYYFNSTGLGVLVYTELHSSILNNTNRSVVLSDFDNGDYSWEVECHSVLNGYSSKDRDFTYSGSQNQSSNLQFTSFNNVSYDGKDIIENLSAMIDSFFVAMQGYGPNEQELISDIGLSDLLLGYKKKIAQSRQDLEHNINYIQGIDKRETRKNEIINDLNSIRDNVPLSLSVDHIEEYSKNTLDSNINDVVQSYIASAHLILTRSDVSSLIEYISNLQRTSSTSVSVKTATVRYINRVESSTYIVKTPIFKNQNITSFIEVIGTPPLESKINIKFLNKFSPVKDNSIYSIKSTDLINGKILYSIIGSVDKETISTSDTLLFTEQVPKQKSFITAFSVLLGADTTLGSMAIYIAWALFFGIFVIGSFAFVKTSRNRSYLQRDDVRAIRSLLQNARIALQSQDVTRAKAIYYQIQENYRFLTPECKTYIYDSIQTLSSRISFMEARSMIQAIGECAREGRKEDATNLYSALQSMYSSLSPIDQSAIFSSLSSYLPFINSI